MKATFLLLHNAAVSEFSHHRIEVVVLSSDPKALIDIIHNEWSVIIHLVLLEDCEHCGLESAMMSPISQAQIILNCSPLPSILLSSNIFEHLVLLHSITLKTFNNILFFLLLWFIIFFFSFIHIFIMISFLNSVTDQLHPSIKNQQITQHF